MSDVHEALKNLVERLHDAARENLESVILYGSAARGDFHEAHSDLNVLCVLRSLRATELGQVSAVVKWWTSVQRQPPPLFFSAEELRQSADVFAIEILDMQQSHRVLYGTDLVAGISVPMMRAVFTGTPTKPENRICGIRISGTRLVAISDVLTIAEISKPNASPTIAVSRIMITCGIAQPGRFINPA